MTTLDGTLATILAWALGVIAVVMALLALIALAFLARKKTSPEGRAAALCYLALCGWLLAWCTGGLAGGILSMLAVVQTMIGVRIWSRGA